MSGEPINEWLLCWTRTCANCVRVQCVQGNNESSGSTRDIKLFNQWNINWEILAAVKVTPFFADAKL